MVPGPGGAGPLRAHLEAEAAKAGCSMKALTVLAPQNDPFRVDTPAGHRDGAWLAMTAQELGLGDRKIHLRGLHYMLLGRPKPDGTPYGNTEADWTWLSVGAAKAARWLGYLPFDQIVDQRNAPPTVRIFQPANPEPGLSVDLNIEIPAAEDLLPRVRLDGFDGAQPYKLVMIGEKSSLAEVLAPVAAAYKADLYLPTGEPSETMVYNMAKVGATDGRPMVVVYFADADPSGWQMSVSVARKLQAFQALAFPELAFQVRRAALTPDQVREYGLPSTPLKDTERRGDAWRAAMGVDQTEIDALASLQPRLLRRIARAALDPFFDPHLDGNVSFAEITWRSAAQAAVDAQVGEAHREHLHAEATQRLEAIRAQLDEVADMRIDPAGFDLPEVPAVPEPDLDGRVYGKPLVDSTWDFAEQCRRLIGSKAYQDHDDGGGGS